MKWPQIQYPENIEQIQQFFISGNFHDCDAQEENINKSESNKQT